MEKKEIPPPICHFSTASGDTTKLMPGDIIAYDTAALCIVLLRKCQFLRVSDGNSTDNKSLAGHIDGNCMLAIASLISATTGLAFQAIELPHYRHCYRFVDHK